jgi:PAS domain S-box-containing protein
MEILVIDDSPDSLCFLTNLLKNRGYRVHSAASAHSALRAIEKRLPNLILLKDNLPDRDLSEFCSQLLSVPDTAQIPLLVMGVGDRIAEIKQWLQAGCADYILAPFEPTDILARVNAHLALKDLQEPLKRKIQAYTKALTRANLELHREVLERAEGQQALQNREGILRSILDSGLDGILVIDLKGKVLTSNPRFVEMWNIPAEMLTEDCQDRRLVEYGLPQIKNPERFRAKIGELYLTSARSIDIIELKDGRVFERFSSPLIRKGEEAGRVWTFHDATERIQTETSLRESELKYRHLVDHIQDVMYKSDCEGNLTMVSPSFAQLLGYSSVEECLGKNIARTFYLHPEDREVFLEKLKRTGVVKDYEIMLRRKDGSAVPVATSSRLLLDAPGAASRRRGDLPGCFRS